MEKMEKNRKKIPNSPKIMKFYVKSCKEKRGKERGVYQFATHI